MKASLFLLLTLIAGSLAIFSVPNRIKLVHISTDFNQPVGIDYFEPYNALIMSAYYSGGQPYNFETVFFDGSHSQFTSIAGLTNEVMIATARSGNIGGWQVGEFFTGNGLDGEITRVSDNGLTVNTRWVSLPGEGNGLMRGSLYVDNTGVWNGDLIAVTTAGQAWRIRNDGTATFIANCGVHLEGVMTVPNDPSRYGSMAGKIIAGNEGNGRLYAFATDGTYTYWQIGCNIEDIDFIYPNENYFGVNYGGGRLLGARASDFAGLEGDILLAQEFANGDGNPSLLYILRWDFTNNRPDVAPLGLTSDSLAPAQWEHVTFAKAGILEIPNPNPQCYKLRYPNGAEADFQPYVIPNGQSSSAYYNYLPSAYYNQFSTSVPSTAELQDHLLVYFTLDYRNLLSLVIHADSHLDGTGGSLSLQLITDNLQNPERIFIKVQNDGTAISTSADSSDNYYWTNGEGYFTFAWGADSNDGLVLSPLPLGNGFSLRLSARSYTGLTAGRIASWDATTSTMSYIPWDLSEEIQLFVYDCSKFCLLFGSCVTCVAHPECAWCENEGECQQLVDPDQATNCPTGPRYESWCPCSFYNDSCTSCTTNPNCGWCCNSPVDTNPCSDGTGSGPAVGTCGTDNENWRYGSCPPETCSGGCGPGECICGRCECPVGYGGTNCLPIGCDGVPGSGAVVDVCGDCGGNGTWCIGCDGTPFGPVYDDCGICDGDGTSCYNPCQRSDCETCVNSERCGWCKDTEECIALMDSPSCPTYIDYGESCDTEFDFGTTEIVAISAGIVALIVIAAVVGVALVGFGAKKGFDYYMTKGKMMEGASSNPMYADEGRTGTNPFYDKK